MQLMSIWSLTEKDSINCLNFKMANNSKVRVVTIVRFLPQRSAACKEVIELS